MRRTNNENVMIALLDTEEAKSNNGNLYTIYDFINHRWVLVNYTTPIAVRDEIGEIWINTEKYSRTTSKIQSQLHFICNRYSWKHSGVFDTDENTLRDMIFIKLPSMSINPRPWWY